MMKRIMYLLLAGTILAGTSVSFSHGQNASSQNSNPQSASVPQTTDPAEPSLGNYARALKKEKKQPAAKQFDNDNLPRQDTLSVVGTGSSSSGTAASQEPTSSDGKNGQANNPAMPGVTPGQSQQERQQVYDQWKDKLASQQAQIDSIAKELDMEQREYKLRAAALYGDAGDRLRNQAEWDKEDADYKQKIADAQKALDDAKQKMSDMQEDARKAGVPTSVREGDQQPQQNQQPQQ